MPVEILIRGLASGYEVEHLTRVFYPGAKVRTGTLTRGALVYAMAGCKHMAVGLRTPDGRCYCRRSQWPEGPFANAGQAIAKEKAMALCRLLYDVLCDATENRPPWGLLTGVRPLSLLRKKRAQLGDEGAKAFFTDTCDVRPDKYGLIAQIAGIQQPFLQQNQPPGYSLYISIPFCPTRCAYCSFVSQSIAKEGHLTGPYLDALEKELQATSLVAKESGLVLRTVYVGGGTPTALAATELDRLLGVVARNFDTESITEYTVEAGRPDCTTPEKLRIIKSYGVGRISINPQTMQDAVLRRIGRAHTAEDIRRCYQEARAVGFDSINMDLIAGLPGDTEDGFSATVREVLAMAPENITLHTLTLKRASDLAKAEYREGASPQAMQKAAYPLFSGAGYLPYYLYRQKSTVENLENTGWALPGQEGVYNICIMEEVHSILACGAGAVTKLVDGGAKNIQRMYNLKYPADYIEHPKEAIRRKEGVKLFYAGNLDTETTG